MKEHLLVTFDGSGGAEANPLNPHNGNLVLRLNDYAKEGWSLASFDWNSWRAAVLEREVPHGEAPNYRALMVHEARDLLDGSGAGLPSTAEYTRGMVELITYSTLHAGEDPAVVKEELTERIPKGLRP